MVDLTSYIKQVKNLRNPQKPPANILFYFVDGGWCIRKMDGWGTQLFGGRWVIKINFSRGQFYYVFGWGEGGKKNTP